MDLTGEVSSGAVEMARSNLEKMLRHCAAVVDTNGLDMAVAADLTNVQEKSIYDVTHELVRQVTSPNKYVREQAIHCLKVLAELTNRSVTEVMAPHKDVLAEMIPPKKTPPSPPANKRSDRFDGWQHVLHHTGAKAL